MKQTKKQQREAVEKAALSQRLTDIACGAYGPYEALNWHNEDEFSGMAGEMGVEAFARWIGGIKSSLLDKDQAYLVDLHNLHHFDYISKATDHLYGYGVRA